MIVTSWSSPRPRSTYTRQRESRAAFTSKEGFSVVAPTRITVPFSTWGRKASCWDRLKRWISSTNRIVRRPRRWRSFSASAMTSRISLTPERTAENAMKRAPATEAISEARVVLPEPGGPQRIIECSWPVSMADAQDAARPEEVLLADDLVQGAWSHPVGQRGFRGASLSRRLAFRARAVDRDGSTGCPNRSTG